MTFQLSLRDVFAKFVRCEIYSTLIEYCRKFVRNKQQELNLYTIKGSPYKLEMRLREGASAITGARSPNHLRYL